jgi:ferredoxin
MEEEATGLSAPKHVKQRGVVMKVRVDKDLCNGYQNCIAICPEIFEMEDDVARVKLDVVPGNLEEKCRDAADACPAEAIVIEE